MISLSNRGHTRCSELFLEPFVMCEGSKPYVEGQSVTFRGKMGNFDVLSQQFRPLSADLRSK